MFRESPIKSSKIMLLKPIQMKRNNVKVITWLLCCFEEEIKQPIGKFPKKYSANLNTTSVISVGYRTSTTWHLGNVMPSHPNCRGNIYLVFWCAQHNTMYEQYDTG